MAKLTKKQMSEMGKKITSEAKQSKSEKRTKKNGTTCMKEAGKAFRKNK